MTGCIERLKKEYEIETRWVAYPLRPDTPEEGLSLEQVFAGSGKDIHEMNIRLKKAAKAAGLPFGHRTMTFNSRFAHEVGKWAESRDYGDDFHKAVFTAYFAEGKNIGRVPVLMDIVGAVGLPRQEARQVIDSRAFAPAVDEDWLRAQQVDPEYIPSLMINGRLAVNPQQYDLFRQFMRDNHIQKRPVTG
ncbi:MAG: DsbA family protein [Desulfobacterales bacterium]|nr:DsbA family protein [Desulfobacterales bacterium]